MPTQQQQLTAWEAITDAPTALTVGMDGAANLIQVTRVFDPANLDSEAALELRVDNRLVARLENYAMKDSTLTVDPSIEDPASIADMLKRVADMSWDLLRLAEDIAGW